MFRQALGDLQEIWIYIARGQVAAANRIEADIYKACEMLATIRILARSARS